MIKENRHWSENDLLDRLYGLDAGPGLSESHLHTCPDCRTRWEVALGSRAAVLSAQGTVPEAREERLRAQRQAVWTRIEQGERNRFWRVAPAAATACLLLVSVMLHRPAPEAPGTQTPATSVSDEQFFTEIASVVNQDAPRAVDPIRGLFSEPSGVEAQ